MSEVVLLTSSFIIIGLFASFFNYAVCNEFDIDEYVTRYRDYDLSRNNGMGKSNHTSSSSLAWGESYILNDYIMLYHVTSDIYWLEKVIQHFDQMIYGMTQDIPRTEPRKFSAEEIDAMVTEVIQIAQSCDFSKQDETGHPLWNTQHPGWYTDRYSVEPKPLQYVVHDGMLLYPIARLIEIVLKNADLQKKFGEKIGIYIKLIREVFVPKWERYWVELENNMGAYRFTESKAERFPNRLLPHNQYNAMCRVYLVLQDRNVLDDPVLREKATKMIRYFKGNLRYTGKAWTWNYWDWGSEENEHSAVEDTSHASINVGTAIEAYHRGIEFQRQDMVKFAHTLLDQVWNGSMEEPNIGDRVDTSKGDRYSPVRHWIELCEFDSQVWNVYSALFKYKGEPTNFIPPVLNAQAIEKI